MSFMLQQVDHWFHQTFLHFPPLNPPCAVARLQIGGKSRQKMVHPTHRPDPKLRPPTGLFFGIYTLSLVRFPKFSEVLLVKMWIKEKRHLWIFLNGFHVVCSINMCWFWREHPGCHVKIFAQLVESNRMTPKVPILSSTTSSLFRKCIYQNSLHTFAAFAK